MPTESPKATPSSPRQETRGQPSGSQLQWATFRPLTSTIPVSQGLKDCHISHLEHCRLAQPQHPSHARPDWRHSTVPAQSAELQHPSAFRTVMGMNRCGMSRYSGQLLVELRASSSEYHPTRQVSGLAREVPMLHTMLQLTEKSSQYSAALASQRYSSPEAQVLALHNGRA